MKREQLEFRIGLFVSSGVILLLVMIIAFGEMHILRRDYQIIGLFAGSVGNVTKGAPVRLAGVDVGKATDIRLDRRGNVKVYLRVYDEFTIKEDAPLVIKQDGILGEHYFEFGAGSAAAKAIPKTGEPVVKGVMQTSMSDLPPKLNELLLQYEPRLAEILENLNKTIAGLNTVIADQRTQENVRNTVRYASETMAKGPELAEKLNSTMAEAKATIAGAKAFIDRLNTTVDGVNGLMAGAKTQMNELGKHYSALASDLRGLSAKMENILNAMQRLTGEASGSSTVGKLLTEDKMYEKLTETLDEARTTLAQVKRTFRYIEENPTALYWGDRNRHKVTAEEQPWWQRVFKITPAPEEEENLEAGPKEPEKAPPDKPGPNGPKSAAPKSGGAK